MPAHQTEIMNSVRTLLTRIVDYAGLFPPAKLDMATTVRNYEDYLSCEDSWMLGRLIVPAKRIGEFLESVGTQSVKKPWSVSSIISSPATDEFEQDLKAIDSFNSEYGESIALIDVVEVRVESSSDIDAALDKLPDDLFPYFEVPIDRDPRGLIAAIAGNNAGAKVRTGGVEAKLFPTVEDLARFINSCASASVPFKATAGLHHTLCHPNTSLGVTEFGFFNVFLAGIFAAGSNIDQKETIAILNEVSIDSFSFNDDHISWNNHKVESSDIQLIRDGFATSFGSCSFDEPRQYLREAGIL